MEENRKEFLICVDSDGCAIDTMDIKHHQCFGPLFVKEWGLEFWEEELLERWNQINLYSETRGINRFKGLSRILGEIHQKKRNIEGLQLFQKWVTETKEWSQPALMQFAQTFEKEEAVCLWKVLSWSEQVNQAVDRIPESQKRAFDGVLEAFQKAADKADIAVVSSANRQAVLQEWELNGLSPYVKVFFAQDAGTKSYCISQLKRLGYSSEKILFIGDAAGDLKAAQENQVLFYPILAGQEKTSWEAFDCFADMFFTGSYSGSVQENQIEKFWNNFKR